MADAEITPNAPTSTDVSPAPSEVVAPVVAKAPVEAPKEVGKVQAEPDKSPREAAGLQDADSHFAKARESRKAKVEAPSDTPPASEGTKVVAPENKDTTTNTPANPNPSITPASNSTQSTQAATVTPTAVTPAAPDPTDFKTRAEKAEAALQSIEQSRQQATAQQLTSQQVTDLNNRYNAIQAKESRLPRIEEAVKYAAETYGFDSEEYQEAVGDYNTDVATLNIAKQDYLERHQRYNQEYSSHRLAAHVQGVDNTLTPHGLTSKDLRAANPRLDLTNPFQVIQATVTVLNQRHATEIQTYKTEIETLKASVEAANAQARDKWDATSPAARPPKGNQATGNGSDPLKFGVASGEDFFARARRARQG